MSRIAGFTRRQLLRAVAGAGLALPFYEAAFGRRAWALDGTARRLIIFYFPDGVPGASAEGEPSEWHARGSTGTSFTLPSVLAPLEAWRSQCVFLNDLSMGGTDAGSHPGGTKKLLTGVDGGRGESIDQYLARTVGASSPHRHLYLGVQSTANGASGDKFISYVGSEVTTPPEDSPIRAFDRLFSGAGGSIGGGTVDVLRQRRLSIIDTVAGDLATLRTALDTTDQGRLDLHLEALREVELRTQALAETTPPESCASPTIDTSAAADPARVFDPDRFPALLRAQVDVMVTAMACGLSRVGVIQGASHTSELVMSRFVGTEMYDPAYDMRSHQASHYGARHDTTHREYVDYVAQRRWWVSQFAYLLEELARRPEGEGTMLDNSMVWLCTEVSDGNTHLHDNMPFVVAGRGGGAIRTGRLLAPGYTRHSNLLAALGRGMGADLWTWGEACSGPLDGLLT